MKSLNELYEIKEKIAPMVNARGENTGYKIIVMIAYSHEIDTKAREIVTSFVDNIKKNNILNITLIQKSYEEDYNFKPIVNVINPSGEKTVYIKVTPEKVVQILEKHVKNGEPILEYTK